MTNRPLVLDIPVCHSSSDSVPIASSGLDWGSEEFRGQTREWHMPDVRPTAQVIEEVLRILPPPMSERDVAQLRIEYPPILASDDPATLEFLGD